MRILEKGASADGGLFLPFHPTSLMNCWKFIISSQWLYNEHHGISNHQRLDCSLNHLFRLRSKKTSKFHVTGLCEENSPMTGEFPTQRASNVENDDIIMSELADITRPNIISLLADTMLTSNSVKFSKAGHIVHDLLHSPLTVNCF